MTMNKLKQLTSLLLPIILLLYGCSGDKQTLSPEQYFNGKSLVSTIRYATLFDVYKTDGIRKVVVHSPFSDTVAAAVFYLVDSSKYKRFQSLKNVLPFPLTRVALLSSTQLNAIYKLKLLKSVAGIADAKYIQNREVKKLMASGAIEEVSARGQLFTEKTIMLNPQAIFFSPYQQGQSLPVKGKIATIPFFDFMEDSPLGRAEWIKFTAAFMGQQTKADSIFAAIETEYQQLEKTVASAHKNPTVFSGKYFNGQWFVPGGKSYMARLFAAAGANYIWKNDSSRNSIPLDFEIVLQKAQNADYWRILGGLPDNNVYGGLLNQNKLYSHFKAFKNHHIIYCDPAATAYFEKSTLEPQVLLKDFIFAFHPELLPGYKPVYYSVKLK